MMGDSEGSFTDQRRPPAPVSQIGAVCNSFIKDSPITIVNVNVNFHVQYQSQPEQGEPCTVQRPEDSGQCPEETGQRYEDTGQRPEDPGHQPEDTGQRPEDPGHQPEDTEQRLEDTGHRLEEGELNGDSDEHKELINSFSLSGSHERQRAGSIQDPVCYSSDFDEIKIEDAKLATGWPMPTDYTCRIAPHSGEVRMHLSASLKLPQRLLQKFLKKSVVVCLVKDMVCISKSSRKNAIDSVVDITKEPFLLNGNELTAGSLVIAVPPNKISMWQAVIDSME